MDPFFGPRAIMRFARENWNTIAGAKVFISKVSVSILEKPRTYIDRGLPAFIMKKILAISTLAIAALMLTPMGIGPVTSLVNFNYSPGVQYV